MFPKVFPESSKDNDVIYFPCRGCETKRLEELAASAEYYSKLMIHLTGGGSKKSYNKDDPFKHLLA